MPLATVNDILARCAAGFEAREGFAIDQRVANVNLNPSPYGCHVQWRYVVPSMPSGVSAFIPSEIDVAGGTGGYFLLVKAIDMGSLNISTNVFTDGAQMPTVTELGVSRQIAGGLLAVVETALNATPGTLSVTYVDQDGNAAQASPAFSMAASTPAESGGIVTLTTPDWGVRDITSAVRAAGTTPTGVVRFYGLIPIGMVSSTGAALASPVSIAPLGLDFNPVRLAAGDLILLLQSGILSARATIGAMQMIGDTP